MPCFFFFFSKQTASASCFRGLRQGKTLHVLPGRFFWARERGGRAYPEYSAQEKQEIFLTHLLKQPSAHVNVSKLTHPKWNTDTQMCSGTGSDVRQSLDIYVHSVKSKRKCLIIQGTERSFESCWQPPFSTDRQLSTLKQQVGLSLKITGPKRSLKYSKFHLQLSNAVWIAHEIDSPQFLSLRY